MSPQTLTRPPRSEPAIGRRLGALAGRTKTVRDVIDQGRSWTVTFSYAGTDAGSVEIERAALEDDDWRIEVPADVEQELETAGYEVRSRESDG